MVIFKRLIIMVIVVFLATPGVWGNDTPSVTTEMEVLEVNEQDHISIRMQFTLINESPDAIQVLKWGTPFEDDFTRDIFDITHDGERALYIGKLVKRLPPTAEDFIEIAGNSELSQMVRLEEGYKIFAPGVYTVQYVDDVLRTKSAEAIPASNTISMKQIPVKSAQTTFEIVKGVNEPVTTAQAFTENVCSDAEFNDINTGYNSAKNIAAVARRALRNAPVDQRPNAQRYLEWFGSYNGSRYATVTANFDRVHNVLQTQTINVICPDDCSSNIFAYVYPSQPYNIHFCGAFFRAPVTGTDSKAGTFVHELTHFTAVAGTSDIAYGQAGARSLARTNPGAAIRNADSHEYFAENTPPLAMPTGGGGSDDDDDSGSGGGCFVQSIMK